jgi:hypothetical protein
MKSASISHATPAATAASADKAAPAKMSPPEAGSSPKRKPRWRRAVGLLLTCSLCIGAGLLMKREQQRRAALSLLEDCGATCMAWHGPWGREHIADVHDWDDLRSRMFFYPDVIVTPLLHSGLSADEESPEEAEVDAENDNTDDSEKEEMLKELHKKDSLKLLAALEVLQPKMLIVRWTHTQSPVFWRRLSQVTSLEGLMTSSFSPMIDDPSFKAMTLTEALMINSMSSELDDRSLKEITRLPRLSVLMLTNSSISDAGLTCLESCPQLKTLSLEGSRVTQQGALACMRRCPNLQIKLNGEGVSRR